MIPWGSELLAIKAFYAALLQTVQQLAHQIPQEVVLLDPHVFLLMHSRLQCEQTRFIYGRRLNQKFRPITILIFQQVGSNFDFLKTLLVVDKILSADFLDLLNRLRNLLAAFVCLTVQPRDVLIKVRCHSVKLATELVHQLFFSLF